MKYAFVLTTPAATGAATLTQTIVLPPNTTIVGARLMVVKANTDTGNSTVYLAPSWIHLGTVARETAAPGNGIALTATITSGATNTTFMVFPPTASANSYVPICGNHGFSVVIAAGADSGTAARSFYCYLATADIRD